MKFLIALVPWMVYGISKLWFRKLKLYILIYGVVLLILGIWQIIKFNAHIIPVGLQFVPFFSSLIIIFMEWVFLKIYEREIKETAFWYLGNGYRSKEENVFNPLILILSLIVPFLLFFILPMILFTSK